MTATVHVLLRIGDAATDAVPESNRKGVARRLRRGLVELLEALGLPLRAELEVRWSSWPSDAHPLVPFELRIDGQPAALPPLVRAVGSYRAEAVLRDVANAFVWAREDFLTESALSAAQERHRRPLDVRILRETLRRHTSLDRLAAAAEAAPGSRADGHLETALDAARRLRIEFAKDRAGVARAPRSAAGRSARADVSGARADVFERYGVLLPEPEWVENAALPAGSFRICVNDVPLPAWPVLRAADRSAPTVRERLLDTCRWCAGSFVTSRAARYALCQVHDTSPTLVRLACRRVNLGLLVSVLRSLVDEGISILDVERLLEELVVCERWTGRRPDGALAYALQGRVVADGAGRTTAARVLAHLRRVRQRELTHAYTGGTGQLDCYLVSQELERHLEDSSPPTERLARAMGEAFEALAESQSLDEHWAPQAVRSPVILIGPAARPILRRLLERELPALGVLSFTELSSDVDLNVLARFGD